MNTIHQDLDDLDRMVDTGAAKDEIRSQIRLVDREVSALEADYSRLADAHANLQQAHSDLQDAHSQLKHKQRGPIADVVTGPQTKRLLPDK